jgi:hypothetical protein
VNKVVDVAFIEVLMSAAEDALPGLVTAASFGPNSNHKEIVLDTFQITQTRMVSGGGAPGKAKDVGTAVLHAATQWLAWHGL